MAVKEWYFPSSTGNYKLPSGKDIRIRIYYNDTTSYSKNMASQIIGIYDLKIPLEVQPSSQTFRFAFLKIEFDNINNEFETESILNSNKIDEIFIDIYIDNQIFWQGILDNARTQKINWYWDGSSFKYRQIRLTFLDRIAYFWKNDKTMADASYSNTITINALFTNIANLCDINSIYFDPNLKFTEYNDALQRDYAIKDLFINRQGNTSLISTFLRKFVIAIGAFIYSLNGKLYIVSRTNGSTQTISNDDISQLDIIENVDFVKYIEVKATLDMSKDTTEFSEYFSIPDITVINENIVSGTKSQKTKENFIIDGTNIIDELFTVRSGAQQYGDYTADLITDSGGEGTLDDDGSGTNAGGYFQYNDVESGDGILYSLPGANFENHSMITSVKQFQLKFYGIGDAINNYKYRVNRGVGSAQRRYKIHYITNMAFNIYKDYFLTGNTLKKIKLIDIVKFKDIEKRFVLNGLNHRAKNITYSFHKNYVLFELVQVP